MSDVAKTYQKLCCLFFNHTYIYIFIVRSNAAIDLWSSPGFRLPYAPDQRFTRDESKFIRTVVFSPDGRFMAWVNGTK